VATAPPFISTPHSNKSGLSGGSASQTELGPEFNHPFFERKTNRALNVVSLVAPTLEGLPERKSIDSFIMPCDLFRQLLLSQVRGVRGQY
jgi:hypothetical protein